MQMNRGNLNKQPHPQPLSERRGGVITEKGNRNPL